MAPSYSQGLRIGDADRQEAVALLGEQYAQGRLTRDELDERTDAVWSARTWGDLAPLFVDLPVPAPGAEPAPAPRAPAAPWRGPLGRIGGLRRVLVPLLVVLVAITVVTHLPFVLLAVGLWFWFGHRHHGRGAYETYAGGWHGRLQSR